MSQSNFRAINQSINKTIKHEASNQLIKKTLELSNFQKIKIFIFKITLLINLSTDQSYNLLLNLVINQSAYSSIDQNMNQSIKCFIYCYK